MSKLNISRQEALEELARRRGILPTPGQFRIEQYLFDKQLKFVQDPAPFKVAVTTRRAGKTISCVADLTSTALANEGCIVLYVTLSRKNAKRLVWPEFKKLNRIYQLGAEVNESDLTLTYPNGSVAYILGAADRTSIEDFRGLAIKKAYLDESQSFPSYIEQLIDDVLGPALMDYDGQLILIGTPGPIPNGYFFDLSRNSNWSHHHWSFFDNPKLPFLKKGLSHQDMLARELKRRGVKATDPSIQREWFGKWVVDESSLVFHYNKDKNDYGQLPTDGHSWTYLLGVDLGFEDSDALAVLAYTDSDPNIYLVEERIDKHQDLTRLFSQVAELNDKYKFDKIVVDTGGLGKKIAEEMAKRWGQAVVAADKARKAEKIELFNDALRTGRFKAKSGSRFAHDSAKVEWDHDKSTPERLVISDRFHSDICDAVVYAYTESYHYTYEAPNKEPEFGTKAWSDREAEDMFRAELERAEEAKAAMGESLETREIQSLDDSNVQKLDRPPLRYQSRFQRKRPS
jgi:hypothetical protein